MKQPNSESCSGRRMTQSMECIIHRFSGIFHSTFDSAVVEYALCNGQHGIQIKNPASLDRYCVTYVWQPLVHYSAGAEGPSERMVPSRLLTMPSRGVTLLCFDLVVSAESSMHGFLQCGSRGGQEVTSGAASPPPSDSCLPLPGMVMTRSLVNPSAPSIVQSGCRPGCDW